MYIFMKISIFIWLRNKGRARTAERDKPVWGWMHSPTDWQGHRGLPQTDKLTNRPARPDAKHARQASRRDATEQPAPNPAEDRARSCSSATQSSWTRIGLQLQKRRRNSNSSNFHSPSPSHHLSRLVREPRYPPLEGISPESAQNFLSVHLRIVWLVSRMASSAPSTSRSGM